MKHLRVMGPGLPSAVLLVCGLAGAARAQLVAVDDTFGVPYGTSLIQEAPGVLANDTYNSDPAEGVATAGLLTYPDYGTLTCESNPALDLCPDGSFTYTPDASFPGFDSFTYEATVASETSQATVTLTACNGGPTVFTCWKEVPYLAKLGELGYRNFQEGFEGDGAWGSVREPDTAPSVSSQGISWTTNHPATNEITTGTGVERTGLWGVYDPAHGYATGSAGECDVDNPPPQCLYKDGFTGTRQPSQSTLYGVGGHFTGSLDPKLVMILDAGAPIGLGLVPVGDPTFFGVIDTTGFTTFRVEETDGKVGQIRLVFGDDFTFATTPADGTPPQVSKVDSVASTGGGELSEGEVTTAAITQLLVTYDELVSEVGAEVGTDSVTNLANYLLFSDGGDGFDTVDCATGVDAGDVAVAVDWVTYTSGSERTATLDLNGGTALPSASYRLLACGTTSIRDWAGNALDGNGNGTGGDDFQRNFTVSTAVECVVDADCDNGLFCDGAENCVASVCVAGTPPNCNDGVGCTVDSCSEGTDSCHHTPNDALCDNGLFCDGAETCNLASDCQPGTPPNCNDGVSCTVDSCNEGTDSCNHAPNDALCDNGLFCDGAETCNLASDCQPGTPPDCNDGVGCTVDSCNEGTDSCNHAPNDALCDNGLFCDGAETCNLVSDCQPGSDPCPGQACDEESDVCADCMVDADCADGLFCNGAETCAAGVCEPGTPPNCNDGVGCTVDSCNEGTDSCNHAPNDALCDNGLFCDGAETCNLASDCQPGTAPNCNDGVGCTVDSCNEGTDSCNHAPNDALCDNGLFCDGAEICNLVSDCQPGSDPCPQGEVCNEVDDICEPGINHEPVAVDDAYATDQGVELDVTAPGVLDNDSDPDGDAITAVKVTDPADGSLILNADGSFTYTPDPGFFGVDSFTYKANDTLLDSNIATVTLTVNEGDTTPPQVALLDSVASTDDHMLLEGEAALVPITQLLVSFDEPVADPPGDGGPDDVTNPSNYLLVAAGVDGNLQTLTCGGPSGDDQPITVAAVDYDDATQTAALHLDGGVSLPVADYRLLVCGSTSIVDLAGNPLDGNGDGTGGDDFALTFSVVRTNELLNPNFDSNLSPWITDSPLPNEIAWEAKDIDDAPTSGSLGIWNLTGAGAFYSLSQCVVLGDANAYDLGGMVWLLSSTAGHPTALGRVDFFAAVDCSGAPLSGTPTDPVQGDTATLWLALETRVAAPPGANSALVTFAIDAGLSPDFDAGFDRLFFAGSDAVFLDGFESGDTSAWSRQVP